MFIMSAFKAGTLDTSRAEHLALFNNWNTLRKQLLDGAPTEYITAQIRSIQRFAAFCNVAIADLQRVRPLVLNAASFHIEHARLRKLIEAIEHMDAYDDAYAFVKRWKEDNKVVLEKIMLAGGNVGDIVFIPAPYRLKVSYEGDLTEAENDARGAITHLSRVPIILSRVPTLTWRDLGPAIMGKEKLQPGIYIIDAADRIKFADGKEVKKLELPAGIFVLVQAAGSAVDAWFTSCRSAAPQERKQPNMDFENLKRDIDESSDTIGEGDSDE